MAKKTISLLIILMVTTILSAQQTINIDGNFDDWANVPVAVTDPADDVHDTDGYPDGGSPAYVEYTDVDLLEVKFTNDAENLYGYMKASGVIGRTSSDTLGHAKKGRYYFIFTIDVDDNTTTGYQLKFGGYYPDSRGYDMNMEVEFYNGGFNTGHYINHEFMTQTQLDTQGLQDLTDGVVKLAPGTYDYYTQWVTFEDSSFVLVADKGPVYQGIITIAVSPDGHEAEMKAPMWGFLKTPEGKRIIDVGQTIVVSASLEASGELSEEAAKLGYIPGSKSVWGSDTAEPFRYTIVNSATPILADKTPQKSIASTPVLYPAYPNPFNSQVKIGFFLPDRQQVQLHIVNSLGQQVASLKSSTLSAGTHFVFWNARNSHSNTLPSGMYYVVLITASNQIVRPLTFIK